MTAVVWCSDVVGALVVRDADLGGRYFEAWGRERIEVFSPLLLL